MKQQTLKMAIYSILWMASQTLFWSIQFAKANSLDDLEMVYTNAQLAMNCHVTIANISSTCQDNGGGNFSSTIEVVIHWSEEPNGEIIAVYLDGSMVGMIDVPNGETSPDTVSFSVIADGSANHELLAQFATSTTCSDTVNLKYDAPCINDLGSPPGEICNSMDATEIAGTVFEDWNYDGLMNQSDTVGVGGVLVIATDCNGNTDTTYTDNNGNYQFTGLTNGDEYRVEFSLPEAVSCWACPTHVGINNGTMIQFVEAGNCASLGIASPSDYCTETTTDFALSCFTAGPRSAIGDEGAIVRAPYTAGTNGVQQPAPAYMATMGQVGTVWGLAYHQPSNQVFSAAFVRRFTDLGPGSGHPNSDGTGTIYATDLDAALPNGAAFVDFDELYGTGYTGINPHPGGDGSTCTEPTASGLGCWAHDPDVFDQVGRIGLGDIDVSTDYETLWAISILTKELIKIPIGQAGTLPPASAIEKYDVPSSSTLYNSLSQCNGVDVLPFGLKYYDGKVFVGLTCIKNQGSTYNAATGEALGWVYSFDPILETWQHELTITTFFKGGGGGHWRGWLTTYSTRYATPWLTDIEFTTTGDMVVGIRDHTGDQYGQNSPSTDTASGNLDEYTISGHLVKACADGTGKWILEDNGSCGGVVGYYQGNGNPDSSQSQGPGGGRFYRIRGAEDYFSQGAIAQLKGSENIALIAYDVEDLYDAGVSWLSNKTGGFARNYQVLDQNDLFGDGRFGKAASLGDIEFMCQEAPIEIGNYIWEDTNGNGLQDACEPPLENVIVTLYDSSCEICAIDTTNANGNYYFNDAKVKEYTAKSDTTLNANSTYYIVITNAVGGNFDTGMGQLTVGGNEYSLTTTNQGSNEEIDSDASIGTACGSLNGLPFIPVQTTQAGCNNHTYDFGWQAISHCTLNINHTYTTNCTGTNIFTADWNMSIQVNGAPDNNIEYQRNSDPIQTHTLTGNTDTLIITGIPADGGLYDTLTVWFANETTCGDTILLKRPVPCPSNLGSPPGEICNNIDPTEIAGTVFEDWNYDGLMNQNDTVGVQGIRVVATNSSGSNDTTYTDNNGNYQFTGLTSGADYRITFNLPAAVSCWACPTHAGSENGTLVQFVQAGECASLGISSPADFCQLNPRLAVPCYVNGDPIPANSASGALDWLVVFDYQNTGNDVPQTKVTGDVIGATWGVAYHQATATILTGAFLKRHVGLGANGTGAIYQIDPNTGAASLFVDLNTYPNVNTGIDPRDGTADNSLPTSEVSPSVDLAAFGLIGKIGLGDIDLSPDGQTLYAINLNEKTLIEIAVGTGLTAPAGVQTYAIEPALASLFSGSDACGNSADYRPFALKVYRGKVYVGAVCSAELSGDETELQAYIIALDQANPAAGFQAVYTFPLTYLRDGTDGPYNAASRAEWLPWVSDNYLDMHQTGGWTIHPSPIFSDLDVDSDGSLVLGFIDRNGHQIGFRNYQPIAGTTTQTNGIGAGDVLRVCYNNDTYTLEGINGCPTNGTGSPFYTVEEFYPFDHVAFGGGDEATDFQHGEISNGGIAVNKGTNSVLISVMDPLTNDSNSGGIETWNSLTGEVINEYELFDSGSSSGPPSAVFGKAHGLGDVEMLCDPAPIEIGNYVWLDTNQDGIQDAGEVGLANVVVTLYNDLCAIVAIDTTDATGNYYFNKAKVKAYTAEPDTIIHPNSTYYVVITNAVGGNFDTGTGQLTVGGNEYSLTTTNQGSNEEIDSDASIGTACGSLNGLPFIPVQTTQAGCNNHTYDFGWQAISHCTLNINHTYTTNCTGTNIFTADWNMSISVNGAPDNNIEYQRNSDPIQIHTLTGNTDTLIITGIPADGGLYDTLTVWFANETTCGDTILLKRPVPCPSNLGSPPGEICNNIDPTEIVGTVFEDWNYDGLMNQSDIIGVAGILVTATDCTGNIDTTYTDATGNYQFTGLTNGEEYRIEFMIPEVVSCWACPTHAGSDNGTLLQFVQAGNCAHLGLAEPSSYCQETPKLLTTCFINGDNENSDAPIDVLVNFNYNDFGRLGEIPQPQQLASKQELGSIYGLAYNKHTQSIYSAAFFKRHAGLKETDPVSGLPLNNPLGAIYVTDTTMQTNQLLIDLSTIAGIELGNVPTNAARQLPNQIDQPSTDSLAYTLIGAVGLGDLELSNDGRTLYVTNLYDKSLIMIQLSATGQVNTVSSVPIPDPACTGGTYRPFGLGIHKGMVYVGVVCDASQSQLVSDLSATIYRFDGQYFSSISDFPLDYPKLYGPGPCISNTWFPWTDQWQTPCNIVNGENIYIYPQPILSDIEFDNNGDMILGFMDRFGHQMGYNNADLTDPPEANHKVLSASGDIIRLCKINNRFELEGATGCASNYNTGGGPNGGEYYDDDYIHDEATLGALVMVPGSPVVITTITDPIIVNSGGVIYLGNELGDSLGMYEVYFGDNQGGGFFPAGYFGKANGLGDLEAMCAEAPLEIGNYVWIDNNENGVQDACEPPLEHVILTLYNTQCEAVAVDTTDAKGQYYFNDTQIKAYTAHPDTLLYADSTYYIILTNAVNGNFDQTNGELTMATNTYTLTTAQQGSNDQIDSDASIETACGPLLDLPFIRVETQKAGCDDHSYDFGFKIESNCPPINCLPIQIEKRTNP